MTGLDGASRSLVAGVLYVALWREGERMAAVEAAVRAEVVGRVELEVGSMRVGRGRRRRRRCEGGRKGSSVCSRGSSSSEVMMMVEGVDYF